MTVRLPSEARAGTTATVDTMERYVDTSARLVARLAKTGGEARDAEHLRAALDVATMQHEELRAAEDELRAQVDELARAVAKLQRERARYRELFDSAPDAYFVTDGAGIIRAANRRASKLLAIPERHIEGKPFPLYVATTSDTRALRCRFSDRTSREVFETTLDLLGRRSAPVRVRLRGIRIDSGEKVLLVVRALGDARGEASSDRALADARELLDRERQARLALERDARARDRLLAALAEDVRVPLNAVLGWTELLRSEPLDQGRREHALAAIAANARALLALGDDLLDISRGERMQLEVRPVDLGGLARAVVDRHVGAASARGAALTASADTEVVILGDAERLRRAVSSLAMRALHASPPGARVQVSVRRVGSRATVAVGCEGVASEQAPGRAFEWLRDGGGEASFCAPDVEPSFVRQVVCLHGGSIEVDGCVARIELPLAYEEDEPQATSVRRDGLAGARVLVSDEDVGSRELFALLLADAGAHVAIARDPTEARRMLPTYRPDAVIADLADGDEMGARIELLSSCRGELGDALVLVAVSCFGSERDARRSLAAGFDAHLSKPVSAGELVSAVAHALAVRRG